MKRFEFREINKGLIIPSVYDNEKQEYGNIFECKEWLNNLHKENQKLAKEIFELKYDRNRLLASNKDLRIEKENLKQALWEAEEEYLYEAYYDNPIRLQDKMEWLKEAWDKEYWNDG